MVGQPARASVELDQQFRLLGFCPETLEVLRGDSGRGFLAGLRVIGPRRVRRNRGAVGKGSPVESGGLR
jgi:hypothetical protein